ncbi:restriction endonuclease subunit S [Proteus mirabilis]|nr:restriction endonuclease subunit S [Proteus mirabilis]
MVPNGWSKHKFYEIVRDTQLGTTERHKGDICNNQIPLLKMGNLTWGGFNLNTVEQLPREKFDSTLLLKKGDFLFNTRNTPELVGKSAVWNDELPEAIFDNNINRISFKNGIDPFYMAAYLNNGRGKAIINSLPAGSTSVAAIYWKDLKNIHITIPPLPEQQKIAKILSTWDKAIATTEKLIATSQQQKKALMQQLLTGKKRLVNSDIGMMFSGDWEHGFLGDLCSFKGGSTFKEIYQGQTKGDYPFIKVSDMSLPNNGKFIVEANNWLSSKLTKEIKVKVFEEGAVVFAKVGAALLLNRRRILVQPTIIDNNMMAATPKKKCHTEFLYQLMLMIDFAKLVQDGAVPSINQSDLGCFKITYPTLIEQQKIASVLTAADKEIELLQVKLAHLKDEKKALMQQLLTGKRRVKVEEVEVA